MGNDLQMITQCPATHARILVVSAGFYMYLSPHRLEEFLGISKQHSLGEEVKSYFLSRCIC